MYLLTDFTDSSNLSLQGWNAVRSIFGVAFTLSQQGVFVVIGQISMKDAIFFRHCSQSLAIR